MRNDTGLVTKDLDTKTFLHDNRHLVTMPVDQKMTLARKINNNQHFKCVLLDFDSNLDRVSLKRAFSLSQKVASKIFALFVWI